MLLFAVELVLFGALSSLPSAPATLASALAAAFVRHPTTRSAKVSARAESTPTAVNSPASKSVGAALRSILAASERKRTATQCAPRARSKAAAGQSRLLGGPRVGRKTAISTPARIEAPACTRSSGTRDAAAVLTVGKRRKSSQDPQHRNKDEAGLLARSRFGYGCHAGLICWRCFLPRFQRPSHVRDFCGDRHVFAERTGGRDHDGRRRNFPAEPDVVVLSSIVRESSVR